MWLVSFHWSPVKCPRVTPAEAHAYLVRPEQSKVLGPSVAKTYGLPICAQAVAAAFPGAPPRYSYGHWTGRRLPVPEPEPYACWRSFCRLAIWSSMVFFWLAKE